jgi:hypothetical protein
MRPQSVVLVFLHGKHNFPWRRAARRLVRLVRRSKAHAITCHQRIFPVTLRQEVDELLHRCARDVHVPNLGHKRARAEHSKCKCIAEKPATNDIGHWTNSKPVSGWLRHKSLLAAAHCMILSPLSAHMRSTCLFRRHETMLKSSRCSH